MGVHTLQTAVVEGRSGMTREEILRHIDHTLLKATCSWEEIQELCEEAIRHQTASICIPPSYIRRVADKYGGSINICTVIGFPLGYHATEVKACEAEKAIRDGAREIDMVVNLGDVKNGDFDAVTREIRLIKEKAGAHILKVIIETCYLTKEEKIKLCRCVTDGGADYIKTSTGFGTGGAVIEDILLFKDQIGPDVKIKAAGGVKTREDMELFIREGCDRIGTSSALRLLEGQETGQY